MSTDSGDDDASNLEPPPRTLLNCGFCGKANPPKTCSACKFEFYCDRDCQRAHHKSHRPACAALKGIMLERMHKIEEAKQILEEKRQATVTECAVCLEDNTTSKTTFVKLTCGHFFCYECLHKCQSQVLQTEITGSGTCPLCREPLPVMIQLLCERNALFILLAEDVRTDEERNEICSVAVKEVESVAQRYPGLPVVWNRLGETHMITGNHGQAVDCFVKGYHAREAMDNVVNSDSVDRMEEALELSEQKPKGGPIDLDTLVNGLVAREDTPDYCDMLIRLAHAYMENGDTQSAGKLLPVVEELVKARWPDDTKFEPDEVVGAKAQYYYNLGEYERALKIVEEIFDPTQLHMDLRMVRARCLMELGNFDKVEHSAAILFYYSPLWDQSTKRDGVKLWNECRRRRKAVM